MAHTSPANDYRPVRTIISFCLIVVILYALMGITRSWTPQLGLDLRGGTTITLTARSVGADTKVPRENLETARGIIQNRVDSLGVGEASVTIQGDDQIQVAVPNVSSDELVDLVGSTARLGFRPVIAMQPLTVQNLQGQTGSSESTSQPADKAERGPLPMLPPQPPAPLSQRPTEVQNPDMSLDDKISYVPTDADTKDFEAFVCGDEFPDVEDQPLISCDQDGTVKYLLGPQIISGERVTDSNAGIPQGQLNWVVNLALDDQGAQDFADATQALSTKQSPQNQFAIVLDHQVVSAPSVHERIPGGHAQISGGSIDEKEARNLSLTLRYGALPVDLEISSVDTVSAALGGNQMTAGIIAGIVGLILVMVYCLFYYRGLTAVVLGSLLMAAAVTYAVVVLLGSAVGFALNLPGIAGAIVAVGVTADSFIVYFERIRDEIREGHRLRPAIESGWKKARNTIMMADGVQLLAAIVLYFLAIGAVKGFAFTLGVTTAIDLFLVFFFTHPLMSLLGRTKFFGRAHKWSGFSPDHLGVSRASLLGRRVAATSQRSHSQEQADE